MKTADYSLYLVTDRACMSINSLEEAVEQAIRGGCAMVQLREKSASSREFYDLARSVKAVTEKYKVPLIINDRTDIALVIDADGVHIGQNDLPVSVVRSLIGEDRILGVSAVNREQAIKAEAEGADYLGVGAMFPTATKPDAQYVSMEELRRIREAVKIPVVVIGGIGRETVLRFKGYGIDGLAVASEILNDKDITGTARELSGLFREVRNRPCYRPD